MDILIICWMSQLSCQRHERVSLRRRRALNSQNAAGASSGDAVGPGDVRQIGPWKIRVLPATHDRLFGKVPFDRPTSQAESPSEALAKAEAPERAGDWVCGEPLAFLIEVNSQRIYIDSGGTPSQLPPNEHVDLAILGMALPDSRARLAAALKRLQPHYILPSHQDNFFRPLSAGFEFGPLTDFPRAQRECARADHSRLILLDYFRPWTLPKAVNPKSQAPNPKQKIKSLKWKTLPRVNLKGNVSICRVRARVRKLPKTIVSAEDVRQLCARQAVAAMDRSR